MSEEIVYAIGGVVFLVAILWHKGYLGAGLKKPAASSTQSALAAVVRAAVAEAEQRETQKLIDALHAKVTEHFNAPTSGGGTLPPPTAKPAVPSPPAASATH